MKILLHILLAFLSISLNAQSSKKIEILNAENSYANSKKHPDYWRLIGNVSFKHNNAIMYCDSAYHYNNKDKMMAFGKIEIIQEDSINLSGNSLTYFGSENKADIKGNVVFIDKYITLKTEQIFYNIETNTANYPTAGTIIDNEKTINSNKGEYNSKTHNFIFKDSVIVIAKDYNITTENMQYNSNSETTYFFGPSYIKSEKKTIYCENGWYNTKNKKAQFRENATITSNEYLIKGDSLYYDKRLGYGKAIKNVEVIDTIENVIVLGGFAEYFEKEDSIEITKNPSLEISFGNDTLFMHANKFIYQQKEGRKKIIAYNKAKFYKSDLQGKCDSLSYNFTDSLMEMFDNPILWSSEHQITADSIQFLMHRGMISHMFLSPKPMIIAKEDSLDYNQIKGKKMTAYFTENKIRRMEVNGNGQSIFFVNNDEKGEKIGLNYTECANLILYFKNNKLDMLNYEFKPISITIPYSELKEKDRFLKGFNWRGNEQPEKKEDIFIE